jgi:hypothetical protein
MWLLILDILGWTQFINLWYTKSKIPLSDISLTKPGGTKVAHEAMIIRKLIAVPTDTLDEDFEVELVNKSKEALEGDTHKGYGRRINRVVFLGGTTC